MAWVRLDIDYMDDPKIWEAGWETAALWPAVLVLLKANDGVLDDQLLSPRYLARKMDCPREVAEAAIDGVKRTGLLTFGTISWKVHKGNVASREGWYSPRWVEHGTPRTRGRSGRSLNVIPPRTLRKVPIPCRRLPNVPKPCRRYPIPCPTTHARAVGLWVGLWGLSQIRKTRDPRRLIWSGPPGGRATSARKAPTSGQRKTIGARLKDHTPGPGGLLPVAPRVAPQAGGVLPPGGTRRLHQHHAAHERG